MDITFFLSQFWGWFLVIIGLVYLVRPALLEEVYELSGNRLFIILSGYLASILGLTTVILHNIWTNDWTVLTTLFGWVSLAKGIMLLLSPETTRNVVTTFRGNKSLTQTLLVVVVLLGAILLWTTY